MNNAKKKKSLRRAKHWGARVWPMAGRMAVILVAVAVMQPVELLSLVDGFVEA